MASSTAAVRIISRRAQEILRAHASKNGKAPPSQITAKSGKLDQTTSWPKSVRYTFYSVCVAAVPFFIGTAISLSPRLREWIIGDEPPTDDNASGFSGRKLIELVRHYWGTEDFVPPIDRPAVEHISPGSRKLWQEDNYSSFLHLLGLDTQKQHSDLPALTKKEEVPMSLTNEPSANIRHDQELLEKFLSPVTNPEGVKARLLLLPCTNDNDVENAGYDTECTLPANVSVDILRQICKGSDAQYTRKVLGDGSPDFRLVSSNERLRTGSWSKDCRWTISFTDLESEEDNSEKVVDHAIDIPSEDNSDLLRKNTSIHSSWSYFQGLSSGVASNPTPALGSSIGVTTVSHDDLRIQQLRHQISTLKQALKDPNSLRDRDDMYAELQQAKSELRRLEPWWRRII